MDIYLTVSLVSGVLVCAEQATSQTQSGHVHSTDLLEAKGIARVKAVAVAVLLVEVVVKTSQQAATHCLRVRQEKGSRGPIDWS